MLRSAATRRENRLVPVRRVTVKTDSAALVDLGLRGSRTAAANAALAFSPEPFLIDTEVEGALKRVTGRLRDLKLLPPGG
jgi:hypothetical protein